MLSLDFTWTAPDTCPTQAAVVEQLSRAVDAGGKELPPLRARALVHQEGAAWRLELQTELDGRSGTRLLEADSCEGLARAATLVMALTLGEGLARRQAEEEAKAAAAAAPPPPPVEPTPPPASPPVVEPREARRLASLSLGVASDALGELTPTALLGVAYQPGSWRLAVSLGAGLPRSSDVGTSGVSVRGHTLNAGAAVCLVPALPPLRVAACGEAGVTWLRVAGRGSESDRSQSLPLYGFGPSLGVEWWLQERAFLGLSLTSRLYVKRPDLVVEASPDRRRVEVASAGLLLGGGVRW